ncbi:MAG: hypothetical protein WCF95_00830 [bacterium]
MGKRNMYKNLKITVCIFVLFLSSLSAYSATIETPTQLVSETTKQKTEETVAQSPKASVDNTFIQIKPEEKPAEIQKEPETPTLKIEATKKQPDVVKLQIEENIFNKNFEKKFDTGVLRDIKMVGGQDIIYTFLKQSNGISHNVSDSEIGLWGVQGHFRDKANTMFNFTMVPYMDIPNYEGQAHRLFEYYIRRPIDEHQTITVGQQRTPNTVEGSRSIFGLPVGRRAQFGGKYSNITSVGVQAAGSWDRIEYRAGIFDTGRFLKNAFETAPEYAALVSFKPIKNTQKYGKLKVGGSYNAGQREYSYNVSGVHLGYDYKKYHFDSEYAYANGYSGRSISNAKSYGYHTTLIYDLTPKVQAFCRLDTLNANTALRGQVCTEYTAGMHYYLKGKKARLTLSYIFTNNDVKPDSNRLFTMLELLL